jgi:hypothetical protein
MTGLTSSSSAPPPPPTPPSTRCSPGKQVSLRRRKTASEVMQVLAEIRTQKEKIDQIVQDTLKKHLKDKLDSSISNGVWGGKDEEDAGVETAFLARAVTAEARKRLPIVKKFKFASQVSFKSLKFIRNWILFVPVFPGLSVARVRPDGVRLWQEPLGPECLYLRERPRRGRRLRLCLPLRPR